MPLSNIKAVFCTYNETSTGILNPINQLARVVHSQTNALFIVDGVSCIGGAPAEMDNWGIDILVTGSQKAMMLPPGLSLLGISDRAWKAIGHFARRFFLLIGLGLLHSTFVWEGDILIHFCSTYYLDFSPEAIPL